MLCQTTSAIKRVVTAVFIEPLLTVIAELTAVIASADVLLLTLGNAELQRSAVYAITPEVGPLSGGTDVMLQVGS